jgi:hypothetical protein
MSIFRGYGLEIPAAPVFPTGDYGDAQFFYGSNDPSFNTDTTAGWFYGDVFNTDVTLPWSSNGTFDYWDLQNNVVIDTTTFSLSTTYRAESQTYAAIAFAEDLRNTTITFDVNILDSSMGGYNNPLFSFGCNASGVGGRLALSAIASWPYGTTHMGGLQSNTGTWLTAASSGANSVILPRNVWMSIKIHYHTDGTATWYYNGNTYEANTAITYGGNYIGISNNAVFDRNWNPHQFWRNLSVVRGIV